AFVDSFLEPVIAEIALDDAVAHGAVELPIGLLRLDDSPQSNFKKPSRIERVVRYEDVARQAVANFARFENGADNVLRQAIRRFPEAIAEREDQQHQQWARRCNGKVRDGVV